MTKSNYVISYIKNHLIRFLLLAVILTTGLTLRMVAFAKYSSYLNDYTSAVAGAFYFSSDYLFSPTENAGHYQINSWNGDSYEVTFEIRNFENSLCYNHEGTDFLYWVEAHVYMDPECEALDTTGFDSTVQVKIDEEEYIGATKTVDGKTIEYGLLKGMDTFSAPIGKQTATVKFDRNGSPETSGHRHLKITAYTVPISDVSSLDMKDGVEYVTKRGVYAASLEAVFDLTILSTTAAITDAVYPSEDYTVCHRLYCNNAEGSGGTVLVKEYFNSYYLAPDVDLGNSYSESSAYTGPYPASAGWRYVQVTINPGGSEDLYFYRKNLSFTITPENKSTYFGFHVVGEEDADLTNYYVICADTVGGSITGVSNSGGTMITSAQMGSQLRVSLAPEEGYVSYGFKVIDEAGNEIGVTKINENLYLFEMSNSNTTLTPVFVRKVQITTTGQGTVTASQTGAPTGSTIFLTVSPEEGHELSTITINGETAALREEIENQLFSFVMPDSAVSVEAKFVSTDTGEDAPITPEEEATE